ncbi:Hypothetical predicted protein [Mytilus galloprovincialis]|uniref:Fibrinogen C-terminal domain-containing protein n=1 Tax=Mytilus galloprovincialis TaxID=29158 RepID=A0A8B6EGV0_MYTGA|nr:Hypothetical predicted protein [Mytilus galloprovincialis]
MTDSQDGTKHMFIFLYQGNKYLHLLTSSGSYKLRVELVRGDGTKFYAEYSNFIVGDAESMYILTVNGYSGNTGDDYMQYYNNGRQFSTFNQSPVHTCILDHGYGALVDLAMRRI